MERGSFRITSATPGRRLGYDAQRNVSPPLVRYVNISFPCATAQNPVVEYELEIAAIYPELPGLENDPRFDPFRRNFLNSFQVIPRRQMLGTNASSDICPFTLYMFAELGAHKVKLAEGLHTSDLVRMTAERYLSGTKGYGQVGYEHSVGILQFADVDPSLVLGAGIYAQSTGDWPWARTHHTEIMRLCRQMLASDTTGTGLIKYGTTGNFGERPTRKQRPANWWDTINFGYEDAYSNALAYRALATWASVAKVLERHEDAAWLETKAKTLRAAYQRVLLNPETGVFAGWRSADGKLHDYWFLFLNSIAVAYDLVDLPQGCAIMERFLHKLDEVGYTNFRIGLPGNPATWCPFPRGIMFYMRIPMRIPRFTECLCVTMEPTPSITTKTAGPPCASFTLPSRRFIASGKPMRRAGCCIRCWKATKLANTKALTSMATPTTGGPGTAKPADTRASPSETTCRS